MKDILFARTKSITHLLASSLFLDESLTIESSSLNTCYIAIGFNEIAYFQRENDFQEQKIPCVKVYIYIYIRIYLFAR